MNERTLLLEVLELRDRLHAGHDHANGYQPNWLARLAKADEFVMGMTKGLEMNLRRTDELLARRDIHSIPSIGQPFDPKTMTAVELVADRYRQHGEVVEEVRTGYLQDEQLLRTAEVVVNNLKDMQIE
jgi:molecular chaperone GrpE